MDPLSDVLSLLRPKSFSADGCGVDGDPAIHWPREGGIKCYAVLAGECWLVVDDIGEPVRMYAGDCFILPRGLPFWLTTNLALTPVDVRVLHEKGTVDELTREPERMSNFLARASFSLDGEHGKLVLEAIPPIAHIRAEADRVQMRGSLERMRGELRAVHPGSSSSANLRP